MHNLNSKNPILVQAASEIYTLLLSKAPENTLLDNELLEITEKEKTEYNAIKSIQKVGQNG